MLDARFSSLVARSLDAEVERSVAYAVVGSGSGAPSVEPCTVDELKAHLRVITDAEDDYLQSIITAARQQIELETERAIPPQTLVYRRRGFPTSRAFFELPRAPARAISSITYLDDTTGDALTVAESVYALGHTQEPARVYLQAGQSWPGNVRDLPGSVVVTYTAGYAAAGAVPKILQLATLWLAAWWYEHRLPVNVGNIVNELPHHLQRVIWGQRVFVAYP